MTSEVLTFRGALIREQSITFAVVEVEPDVLARGDKAIKAERSRYQPVFKDVPIILAARGPDRRAHYAGRPDVVRYLLSCEWQRIPWRKYKAKKKDPNPFREW
ncbi:MAG: hypothetical protein ACLFNT_02445 [Spirochaetales bacterium]